MALNFPDSPSNGDTTTLNGVSYTYDSTKTVWVSTTGPITTVAVSDNAPATPTDGDMWFNSSDLKLYIRYNDGATSQWIIAAPAGPAGADSTVAGPSGGDGRAGVYADMAALIAKTGMVAGDTALVTALNKVFMYTGSAWFLIATMTNASPSAITGVNSTYGLATDGTATTITAVSTDPEGFALTWSYAVTTGSLGSTATVSQADNVFTVTPSTTEADAGSFSITFSVTDGATGAVNAVSAFSLSFTVPNSRYTALSVKATNTGSNQTFVDASTLNHTVTANGDVAASTFSPYRHGGYAPTFGQANGSSLKVNGSTGVSMGAGDYTIECWINITKDGTQTLFGNTAHRIILINGIFYDWASNGTQTAFAIGGTNWSYTANMYKWVHLAITRTSGVVKAWIDGVGSSNTVSDTSTWSMSRIGAKADASGEVFNGQMKDIRIVVGTAVYSSDFTPPSEPLTAISGTQLLIGSLPYLKDQSTNNYSITPYSTEITVEPAATFDNGPYSEASHGASVYFGEANGNAIIIPNFAPTTTGDYTIEFWIRYNTNKSGSQTLSAVDGQHRIVYNAGRFIDWTSGGTQTYWQNADGTLYQSERPGIWTHFAQTRTSGVVKAWINGVGSANTVTDNTSWATSRFGSEHNSSSENFEGDMADIRITHSAIYSSDFTPPTAPLTAVTNTKFLLNPETSISDLSQSSAITCIADAATSTTQVKFAGTKSTYLDGTGDFLQSSESVNIAGDWTIEGWYYFTTLAADHSFFTIGDSASQTNSMEFMYRGASINELRFYNMGSGYSNQHAPPADFLVNNWIHIAVVRSGTGTNNIKAYINGTQSGTGITSNNDLIGKVNIGTELYNGAGTWFTQGYIQDFRVSSIARYTSTFTPPTTELEG